MTRPVAEDALERGRAVVREVFGHADFRPGQEGPVAALIEGRDVLALMPTGKGKSLCLTGVDITMCRQCGEGTLRQIPLLEPRHCTAMAAMKTDRHDDAPLPIQAR